MKDAYENVINRLLTVETPLRKHAQRLGAQSEQMSDNYVQQAELIATHAKRCEWLHDHLANTASDIEKKLNEHHDKLNVHGLRGAEMVQTFAQIDDTRDNPKNMVAKSLAAVDSLSNSRNQSQQSRPAIYNMSTPQTTAGEVPVPDMNEDPDLANASPFNRPASPSVDTPPGRS